MEALESERAAMEEAHANAVASLRAEAEASSSREQDARDIHSRESEVWRGRESELMADLASKSDAMASARAECTELQAVLQLTSLVFKVAGKFIFLKVEMN